jgi:hypothetical protein
MTQTNGEDKGKCPAPLPLKVTKEEDNEKKLPFKHFSNPADATSAKVNKTVCIINS